MAYFAPYIDAAGLHMPDYEDRLEELTAAYRRIFGADTVLDPAVPDAQLLSVFARALDDVSALLLQVYSSRSPLYAQGASLDLLGPLYGLTRRGMTRSSAELVFTGAAGTVIPASSVAADGNGLLWKTRSSVTLDSSGSGRGTADCETPGPVTAPAGSIRNIVTAAAGWTGVTNPAPGGGGLAEETDSELRQRMMGAFDTGAGTAEALRASILSLPGVSDCSVWVNDTGEAADGLPAHSVSVVAEGGTDADIARMILAKKAPGVATGGEVSVPVADAWSIAREIRFSRPAAVPVSLAVVLSGAPAAGTAATLKAALVQRVSAMRIGETLYLSRLISLCAEILAAESPNLYVRGMQAAVGQSLSSEAIVLPRNGKAAIGTGGIAIGV